MARRSLPLLLAAAVVPATVACQRPALTSADRVEPPDARVTALADTYLDAYLERYPEQATYFGIPGRSHDRLSDNSLAAQKAWEAREDAWLTEAKAIDPATLQQASLRATYAIVREALEGAAGARVCRSELWNVSQMTGWHVNHGYLITIQPVGTDDARKEALARWSALPTYIDTEIANAREGLRLKFSAPRDNVRIVIGQIDSLLSGGEAESPFTSPAQRDKTSAFTAAFTTLYRDQIAPALTRYRDFLQHEYLPAARDMIAVTANPDGLACYGAAVRYFSTLPIEASEVHETGLRQVADLTAEMHVIAERRFRTSDVKSLLQKVRSDPQYMFKSRAALIGYSEAALDRAKAAAPAWFGLLPEADVRIEPYPRYRERNAANEYNAPAEDGTRPGLFYINAYQAETKSISPAESTAFHETIPGHHLQVAIALERKDIHPIGRYIFNSGFAEGWGLYAERLADEMKLYSSDLDRLGMLSSQAFRAARLVVDSGMHTMGWTRQRAIDYLLANTTEAHDDITSEIDRYIIWPGQATAYMLGMLEIRRARDQAQAVIGTGFDIKAFHDRVLEDGSVPITFLTSKIRSWAQSAP
ncbi:MAG: DUF885 family protein [Luteitalea sp.]|nr:DUF885 family protein [Luteitalea sp.]